MLAAHLDEVGFAVQQITANGLLRFVTLGGWWGHVLPGQRVRIKTMDGTERTGVIAAKPPHMLQDDEKNRVLKPEQMFIDVGAVDRADVSSRLQIRLGDPIVPHSSFEVVDDGDVMLGKAFDDRLGVALMVQTARYLADRDTPNTVWAVGTVQEEVGARGARTAVHTVNPDVAIILEGPPADDAPAPDADGCQGALGAGVQVRLLDPGTLMNRRLAELALTVAEEHDIVVQTAVRRGGGTDAAAIHLHASGVPSLVLGVPVRYAHTHNGMIRLSDYCGALSLVTELVCRLDAETVAGLSAFPTGSGQGT